jgi:hypothetical protein
MVENEQCQRDDFLPEQAELKLTNALLNATSLLKCSWSLDAGETPAVPINPVSLLNCWPNNARFEHKRIVSSLADTLLLTYRKVVHFVRQ